MHGGTSLRGIGHPNFQNKGYSKEFLTRNRRFQRQVAAEAERIYKALEERLTRPKTVTKERPGFTDEEIVRLIELWKTIGDSSA
jgi:hypothetical protein